MLKYLVVLISCFCSCAYFFELETSTDPIVGYYWVPFTGVIPKKALPGGTNRNGTVTYIGQAYDGGLVTPAKIDLDNNSVSYEWGYKEYFVTKGINILCVNHPEQFQWHTSANGLLQNLKDKHLVRGGYEEDANIYIGRIQLDDELSVGKVIEGPRQTTLNTVRDGVGYQHAVFQILVYNPNVRVKDDAKCTASSIIINFFKDHINMLKYLVLISCFCSCAYFFELETGKNPVAGYYWVPFTGIIPKKALPGGTNRNGTVTYIGQAYDKGFITPAKIDMDNNSVSYEWGAQEHFVTEGINIFCVEHPEQFQWHTSANGLFQTLKDKHLVRGGYENENPNIYIGRIQLDDELSIGKIVERPEYTTLHIGRDGIGHRHAVFQILVYNPNIPVKENTKCTASSIIVNFFKLSRDLQTTSKTTFGFSNGQFTHIRDGPVPWFFQQGKKYDSRIFKELVHTYPTRMPVIALSVADP
ncbi:hypothetical protein FQR65_LT01154 [Abscondita terminalis]|nr:hypothetical protein FQR65_LT01154 [Abscondita terminalis]